MFFALLCFALAGCKSECDRYLEKFCADQQSPLCASARERSKNWTQDQCRLERNQLEIEEQSKRLEQELK